MRRAPNRPSRLTTLIAFIVIVGSLHFARDVLIPIALAGLLALLLTPIVRGLEHRGLRPALAVTAATLVAIVSAAGFAWVLSWQVADLAERIPQYRHNIQAKTESLGAVGGYVGKAYAAFRDVSEQVATSAQKAAAEPTVTTTTVQTVRVVEPPLTPAQIVGGIVVAWAETLGTAVMVLVLVVFLLAYRRDLGDRLVHVFGRARVPVTSHAMDDAGQNVGNYLLALSIVNAAYGAIIATGLLALGVPNALLLGIVAGLLRFIPYAGPWLGLVVPLLLSLAVFEGWTRPLFLLAGWVVVEVVIANVVEPLVYGRRTLLSPLGVLLGTLFWTWLWGVPGLVLAVPMTVTIFVLGRSIPQLSFLDTLFGSDTALEPPVQLYHRLLGPNSDAAFSLTSHHAKDAPLVKVCDELLLPAMALAEGDRHRGDLDEDRSAALLENAKLLVHRLAERGRAARPLPHASPIVILPAADEADEVVAVMLRECLLREGLRAKVEWCGERPGVKTSRACSAEGAVVCISAVPPEASTAARRLSQRILAKRPGTRVVIGLWTSPDLEIARRRAAPAGDALVVTTIADAVREIRAGAVARPAPTAA